MPAWENKDLNFSFKYIVVIVINSPTLFILNFSCFIFFKPPVFCAKTHCCTYAIKHFYERMISHTMAGHLFFCLFQALNGAYLFLEILFFLFSGWLCVACIYIIR